MSRALRRQASRWLLRLEREDATEADRAQFEAWLRADRAHEAAFRQLTRARAWTAANTDAVRAAAQQVADKEQARARVLRRSAPYVVGAGALGACLVMALAWFAPGPAQLYATAVGEQRQLELQEGTRITLNTDTALELRLSRQMRRVRLERGEAMFEVAADRSRPFEVEAQGQSVRVVGTAFAVRVRPQQLDVLVTQGVVSIGPTGGGAARQVGAGERFELRGGQALVRALPANAAARALAWREGMLMFEGERLTDVAAEVARHTGARFTITDPALEQLSVVAYVRARNLEGFLELLEGSFPELDVRRDGATVVIAPHADARE